MKKRLVLCPCVVAGIVVTGAVCLALAFTNRAVIRNLSGADLSDVRLLIWDREGEGEVRAEKRVPRLAPGAEAVVRHRLNDSRGELCFVLAGREHRYDEEYIDLWTGECWLFDVLADGSVRSGYDRSGGQ